MADLYDYDLSDDDIALLFQRGGFARQVVTCKYCGTKGLHWKSFFGDWFPAEPGGKRHRCQRQSAADAFTVIP